MHKKLGLANHVIVLVGHSKKQVNELPDGIIGIERIDSPQELAAVYSAADIFFNPTREDNCPTVNLESEACGTPVITYCSGGSAETVHLNDSCAVIGLEYAATVLKTYIDARGKSK